MSATVFLVVLAAALLHALWNALLKGNDDKLVGMAAIVIGHMVPGAIALLFVPMPLEASYPYLLGGIVGHFGYQLFLANAYRIGDFTQVYPIARGTGPLLVTLVSVFFLGEELSRLEILAVLLIVIGIISLSIVRQGDGLRNPKAASMAVITGCFIAIYSIFDGLGARLSGSPVGFMSLLMLINGVLFSGYLAVRSPGVVRKAWSDAKPTLLLGGAASYIAYVLVVWAFTQAPIPLVTALRETSIVFAILIGVFFFREKLNLAKVLATAFSLTGAALLRFGKFLV